jgi:hypothetical protein
MAVVAAGNETIVRYSLWLIAVYYLLVFGCAVIAALSLLVALGEAVGAGSWKDKCLGVLGWLVGAASFALMAIQVYTMGRAYRQTWVAIGPAGVRMRLPRADGDLLAIGKEQHVSWDEISDITYQGDWRRRVCQFRGGDYLYTLTPNNCPSPQKVAKLLAERKGVPLMTNQVTSQKASL